MTLAFQRDAEAVLRHGGYEYDRKSGKEHGVWKHPDKARPPIHVPGTPRDPDYALIRIRRAVRVGSTPHIPQGLEADMTRPKHVHASEKPLAEQLAAMAPPGLQRRVSALARGQQPEKVSTADLAAWMRKMLQSKGALPNKALNEAAEALHLNAGHLSAARSSAGAVTFHLSGEGGPNGTYQTDFAKRVPEGAGISVGRGGVAARDARVKAGPVTRTFVDPKTLLPKDPDEPGGRRLDQGDLTPEQHAEAERRMKESTERADREAEEIRARLAAGFATGSREVAVSPVAAESNGRPKSQLEIAMQLLQEAALADTHALTDEDLTTLRGHQDTLKRLRGDLDGMSASIGAILKRVDTRSTSNAA